MIYGVSWCIYRISGRPDTDPSLPMTGNWPWFSIGFVLNQKDEAEAYISFAGLKHIALIMRDFRWNPAKRQVIDATMVISISSQIFVLANCMMMIMKIRLNLFSSLRKNGCLWLNNGKWIRFCMRISNGSIIHFIV